MRITGEIIVADNMPRVQLSVDEVANTLSFLTLEEIMPLRLVNMTWKDAAKKTIVPPTNFLVNNERRYNAMGVMARVLPNLQQIAIGYLGDGHKWSDGEDPNEEWATMSSNRTTHDVGIISNFSMLRSLTIDAAYLNGRYPVLFNFPLLQKLTIKDGGILKWDLEMLAGMPSLKELECDRNDRMTGNINNLRVLKDTLEKVVIDFCPDVKGNFMDLADFPRLKVLNLFGTAVTGDIRDIGDNDFSSLERLILPKGVYGGRSYELQRISDAPHVARAVYLFNKQRPVQKIKDWYASLTRSSPDWYQHFDFDFPTPFRIRFVQAGSRIGYRWESLCILGSCEVNWLDPEPDRESSDYGKYIEELEEINSHVTFYRGFHQPPTEEEYLDLVHR
jgi:hypothetical protein